jgi:hypothetical protein
MKSAQRLSMVIDPTRFHAESIGHFSDRKKRRYFNLRCNGLSHRRPLRVHKPSLGFLHAIAILRKEEISETEHRHVSGCEAALYFRWKTHVHQRNTALI